MALSFSFLFSRRRLGVRQNAGILNLDLRTLKGTLQLEQLTCTSPDMIAKEIHAAMITYNLVRAVMWAAAAQTPEQAQALIEKTMYCVGQKKLRHRKRRRSYPRAAWGRPRTFPSRKA